MASNYTPPTAFRGHLGLRVRYFRKQRELTQAVLARRAGVHQSFLSEIERGLRNPSPATLKAIAQALDIPPAVLVGPGVEHDAPQPLETMDVPLFSSIPASPLGDDREHVETFPVLRHLWSRNRYCLRLTFDSMEPTLKPGDIVLVEYRPHVNPEHVQGRICACLIDDKPTLKRVAVERHGEAKTVILRSDNPDVPPVKIDPKSRFSVQGVVTHLVSRTL